MEGINLVIKKIKELKKLAPSDWAKRLAEEMNVTENTVYAYANGERGKRKYMYREVYRRLSVLVAKEEDKTRELINQ